MIPRHMLGDPPALVAWLRARLHLTQAELALMLGVHVHAVWRWEHGVNQPRPKHQRRLVALYERTRAGTIGA